MGVSLLPHFPHFPFPSKMAVVERKGQDIGGGVPTDVGWFANYGIEPRFWSRFLRLASPLSADYQGGDIERLPHYLLEENGMSSEHSTVTR
jgi:hypothetical protein